MQWLAGITGFLLILQAAFSQSTLAEERYLSGKKRYLSGKIGDEFVTYAVEAATAMLPAGKLPDGSPLEPATPEEQRNGMIPLNDAQRIVNLAADTALAEFCELDWRRLSFQPVMRRERSRDRWSNRQLAFIGILHGFVQGSYRDLLQKHEHCTSEHQKAVEDFLSNKQW